MDDKKVYLYKSAAPPVLQEAIVTMNRTFFGRMHTAGTPAIIAGCTACLLASGWLHGTYARDVKKLILDEQKIEGKIRRPQMVLITAEQRPDFSPMVLQSLGKNANLIRSVNQSVIEQSPYDKPFQFQGKTIVNFSP